MITRRTMAGLAPALVFGTIAPSAFASGVGIRPAKPNARIVVTGSYLAEIVVDLGMASQIVAVGGGIDHVTALRNVQRLAGFRQRGPELILAQRPDLYISTTDITDAAMGNQLQTAGVQVAIFEPEPTLAGISERIAELGLMLNKRREAQTLTRRFQADLANARALVARARTKPKGLFILSGGNRPTLVAGRNTGPANLIELAGGINVATAIEGFKVMSQEAMVAAAPDFILLNRDGLDERNGTPVALTAPGALLTPAGRNRRLVTMPGEFLQGFGLLTPSAMRALARVLHPELAGR